jgi:hypothetical protein
MNLASFVDELIKVGAMNALMKVGGEADVSSDAGSSDQPASMVGSSPFPDALRVVPARVSTRLAETFDHPSAIESGDLGSVTSATAPIDGDADSP